MKPRGDGCGIRSLSTSQLQRPSTQIRFCSVCQSGFERSLSGFVPAPTRLSIELEGLRCRIHGEERTRAWADMNIRLRHGRHPTRLLQVLGDLGRGNRLTQRRGDVNDRKAISDVRRLLRTYVMPLDEDPFHEFEDGWGIKFTVNDQIGRRQVKTIEDDEIADRTDEDSPFTYQDDIDPGEMAGFSIRRT